MNQAKIRLSANEMELVTNAGWILTKNAIMEKTKWLLESLQNVQEQTIQLHTAWLPPEVLVPRAKISKGENYQGLPYLILDHPRLFEKEHVFAIRTMFWWGQFFSVTLQLSGRYQEGFQQKLSAHYDELIKSNYHIGVHASPWEHHFGHDNYRAISDFTSVEWADMLTNRPFIKLSKKIQLNQWEEAQDLLAWEFVRLVEFLTEE